VNIMVRHTKHLNFLVFLSLLFLKIIRQFVIQYNILIYIIIQICVKHLFFSCTNTFENNVFISKIYILFLPWQLVVRATCIIYP